MPKAIVIFAAALLLGSAASPAQMPAAGKTVKFAVPQDHFRSALFANITFVHRQEADSRNAIATCTNLAASRALEAKAVGAGYAAQNRILDMAFVLCLAGPGIAE